MSARLFHAALVAFALLVASACEPPAVRVDGDDRTESGRVPTWEEFRASVYKEPFENGVYIVNGDTPIVSEAKLYEFYRELYTTGLIVHQSGGVDARWDSSQQVNLTYCISNAFGGNKGALIAAFDSATMAGWEASANVNFIHDTSQDGNCNEFNNSVVFDVRPISGAPYLARAFFPDQSRTTRNVIVDLSAFSSGWPLDGIIGHELGHALGFRHEHTRPESGACFEDNNWRPLTPYDSSSIMHYPQCNGTGAPLQFSSSDRAGVAALYGPPSPGGGGGYQGCFEDAPERALPVARGSFGNMTPDLCRSLCGGFTYAGVQWFSECFCGNALAYSQRPDGECNTPCTGNGAIMCGGAWRNSIYAVGSAPPPPGNVVFYEHIDFVGASFAAGGDVSWVGPEWNDRISSLRIPPGRTVILYEHIDFGGASVTLTSDHPDLRQVGFNDGASSMRVF